MAKLLCFVAVLVVASAILAHAHTAPPPPPAKTAPAPAPAHPIVKTPPKYNLKCIIHNVATKDVTFKLVIRGKIAGRVVVAKAGKWTAIGPVKVGCKVPVVNVWVSVKTYKGYVVKKTFPVKLFKVLKDIVPGSTKSFALSAHEAKSWWGKKLLLVKLGKKVVLTVKL